MILDGNIIRSHPSYSNMGSWHDHAFFRWQGFERNIAVRIMTILDLSDYDINYDTYVNPDITSAVSNDVDINHLTNEKWVVI